jgi:hypothetical protein
MVARTEDIVVDGFLVEPQNHGGAGTTWEQVMSGDWPRLHQVRGVSSGSPQNHWVTWLSQKAKAEDFMWLTDQNQSDRFGVTGHQDASNWRTRDMIARVPSVLPGLVLDAHPSDGANHVLTKMPLHGLVL